MNMYDVTIKGTKFVVKPSTKKTKKYDVFDENGKMVLSFGARGYEHYRDKFGWYSSQDHNDPKRRENYRKRHKHTDFNNIYSPALWSWVYLW